jgi:hypothetical protein
VWRWQRPEDFKLQAILGLDMARSCLKNKTKQNKNSKQTKQCFIFSEVYIEDDLDVKCILMLAVVHTQLLRRWRSAGLQFKASPAKELSRSYLNQLFWCGGSHL